MFLEEVLVLCSYLYGMHFSFLRTSVEIVWPCGTRLHFSTTYFYIPTAYSQATTGCQKFRDTILPIRIV
jgi:hypothetical protein